MEETETARQRRAAVVYFILEQRKMVKKKNVNNLRKSAVRLQLQSIDSPGRI
jgi:hypothetical protein